MGAAALIERKRNGLEHSKEEIGELVRAYSSGEIDDEQFAPWLHAVMRVGLTRDETTWLTLAMAGSGVTLSWRDVPGIVLDKHSTGGVGDAVSLIAVPLAAACGVKVAKLSGRALGHTGGTIDKLECVPGLRTDLSVAAFEAQVAQVGCAIAQSTDEIAPADKKMYALRNRTNTVDDVALITASVLSKKIAGGAKHIAIDVKCGRSSFMPTQAQALALARSIADVAARCGLHATVLVTDMDAPLAGSVGDALELDEALGVLQGREGGKLREVSLAVAEAMLALPHGDDRSGAPARTAALEHALRSGAAYASFAAMAAAQGGNVMGFDRSWEAALTVTAPRAGYICGIDGRTIGETIAAIKGHTGGRLSARIGVRLRKTEGDAVTRGEPLADVFGPAGAATSSLAQIASNAIEISDQAQASRPAVIERLHVAPAGL
jgi:pyrimidine-nucleoside phosphorylase